MSGGLLPGARPRIKERQLDPQDRGVNAVETEIAAHQFMNVFGVRAVPAQKANFIGQGTVIGDHGAAVAETAQVLGWEERVTAGRSDRSRSSPLVLGADRLGGVFDHG